MALRALRRNSSSFHSLDCSLGRQCSSISIHSQFLFSFSKRKEMEWMKLSERRGHKSFSSTATIDSISAMLPFRQFYALFTSTFIPLYCYNTFLFNLFHSMKTMNGINQIKKKSFIFFLVGWWNELLSWMVVLPPSLKFKEFQITGWWVMNCLPAQLN